MKPVDADSGPYIGFNKENNKVDPKFEVADHVRISKYKNIFAKDYTPNWSQEIVGTFYEKELQKTNQKEFIVAKVIKRKVNKLYVK